MENPISLTLSNLTAKQATALLAVYSGGKEETATAQTRENKAGKGPKGKKAATTTVDDDDEEVVEDDEDETTDDDEDTLEAASDDDEDGGPTYEDVVKAFKRWSRSIDDVKVMRKERMAILKKFKVESPTDLEEKDYAAVIKLLKTKTK